jgi:hypothetical protein
LITVKKMLFPNSADRFNKIKQLILRVVVVVGLLFVVWGAIR